MPNFSLFQLGYLSYPIIIFKTSMLCAFKIDREEMEEVKVKEVVKGSGERFQ